MPADLIRDLSASLFTRSFSSIPSSLRSCPRRKAPVSSFIRMFTPIRLRLPISTPLRRGMCPWSWYPKALSYRAWLSVATRPPSPELMTLKMLKENAPTSPKVPQSLPLVFSPDGLAAILDDGDFAPLRQGEDPVHGARVSQHVDRDDRPRLAVILPSASCGSMVRRFIDLRQDGSGSHFDDGGDGSDKGVAGHEDLVPRPDPQRFQGAHERARSRVDRHGVRKPDLRRELPLETVDLLLESRIGIFSVAGEVPALENIQDFIDLFVSRQVSARTRHDDLLAARLRQPLTLLAAGLPQLLKGLVAQKNDPLFLDDLVRLFRGEELQVLCARLPRRSDRFKLRVRHPGMECPFRQSRREAPAAA